MASLDDEIIERCSAYVSERTGITRAKVFEVMSVVAEYWANHPQLSQAFMSSDEDSSDIPSEQDDDT